jgi:hypothetical protein
MPLPREDVDATTPQFLRDKYAVVGVGETAFTRGSNMIQRLCGRLCSSIRARITRWPVKSSFAGQKCRLTYTTLDTPKGNWTTKRSQFELLMGPRQGEA